MGVFLKISAGVLVASVLTLVLSGYCKDISLLLTLFVCAVVLIAASVYLEPIIDFAQRLIQLGNISQDYLNVLLKITGIGLISQISGLICSDTGNQSMAKVLQIATTTVIICISVPLLEEILTLIETILGEI